MLPLFIAYRVKEAVGPSASIPYIEGEIFRAFVEAPDYTVALFQQASSVMDFANFAIEKNQNRTVFIRAGAEEGSLYGCHFYPCAAMLKKGKLMNLAPILRPIPFYEWIVNNLYNTQEYLNSTEAVREVLEGFKTTIFSVDGADKPKKLPDDVNFYRVNSKTLSKLRINVEKGNYIYTPSNRKFEVYKGKVPEPILRDPRQFDMTDRKYFAGYVIDKYNDKQSEKYVEILESLAAKYKDSFSFSIISGANAAFLTKTGEVEGLDPPFFMAFDSNHLLDGRWLLYRQEDDFENETAVSAFIDRIIEGKEDFTIVSEPIPEPTEGPLEKIVGSNFAEKVFSSEHDSIVAFVAEFARQSEHAMLLMNETALLFKDRPIRIYWIDGSLNDVPKSVPSYERYPTIMMWPAGSTEAIVHSGRRSAETMVKFIEKHSALNVTAPEHNAEEIDDRISAILHPRTAKAEKEFKAAKKAEGKDDDDDEVPEPTISPEEEAIAQQIRDITAQALKEVAARHNATAANATANCEEAKPGEAKEEAKDKEMKEEVTEEMKKNDKVDDEPKDEIHEEEKHKIPKSSQEKLEQLEKLTEELDKKEKDIDKNLKSEASLDEKIRKAEEKMREAQELFEKTKVEIEKMKNEAKINNDL